MKYEIILPVSRIRITKFVEALDALLSGKIDPKLGQGGELLTIILGQPIHLLCAYTQCTLICTRHLPCQILGMLKQSLSPQNSYSSRMRSYVFTTY